MSQTLSGRNTVAFHLIFSFEKERKEKEETKPNQTKPTTFVLCYSFPQTIHNMSSKESDQKYRLTPIIYIIQLLNTGKSVIR